MSKDTNQPQLPPTSAIDSVTNVAFENWFEYPVGRNLTTRTMQVLFGMALI